jgi:protein-S-isoprenylcysteine O-methyltransferase Ste14
MQALTLWNCLMWAWLGLEILVFVITRTRSGGGKVQDRGSMLLLWIVIVASLMGSAWVREFVNRETLPAGIDFGAHWLRPLSLIVLVTGLAIRVTAILSLGKSFSANVAIRAEQKVHRAGLYRFVRHPSYSGLLIIFLAVGLHARNWASLAVMLVPTTLALLYRIHVEEAALRQAFGEEYVEYTRVTKRLIPGIF